MFRTLERAGAALNSLETNTFPNRLAIMVLAVSANLAAPACVRAAVMALVASALAVQLLCSNAKTAKVAARARIFWIDAVLIGGKPLK